MTRGSHLFGHFSPIKPLDKDFSVGKAKWIELFMEHEQLSQCNVKKKQQLGKTPTK